MDREEYSKDELYEKCMKAAYSSKIKIIHDYTLFDIDKMLLKAALSYYNFRTKIYILLGVSRIFQIQMNSVEDSTKKLAEHYIQKLARKNTQRKNKLLSIPKREFIFDESVEFDTSFFDEQGSFEDNFIPSIADLDFGDVEVNRSADEQLLHGSIHDMPEFRDLIQQAQKRRKIIDREIGYDQSVFLAKIRTFGLVKKQEPVSPFQKSDLNFKLPVQIRGLFEQNSQRLAVETIREGYDNVDIDFFEPMAGFDSSTMNVSASSTGTHISNSGNENADFILTHDSAPSMFSFNLFVNDLNNFGKAQSFLNLLDMCAKKLCTPQQNLPFGDILCQKIYL